MQAWNDLRADSDKLKELLSRGNSFKFHSLSALSSKEFLHVYPAVRKNKLRFYLLSSRYDTQKCKKKELRKHLGRAKFKFQKFPGNKKSDSISQKEAEELIGNWEANALAWWINEQCKKFGGLLSAFAIPGSDIPCKGEMIAFLALSKNKPLENDPYMADLVIWARDERLVPYIYSDTVRPVPPFGGGLGSERQAFYLFELAGINL